MSRKSVFTLFTLHIQLYLSRTIFSDEWKIIAKFRARPLQYILDMFPRYTNYLNLAIRKHTLKPLNTVCDLCLRYIDNLNFPERIASQVFKALMLIEFITINFNNIESRLLLCRKYVSPTLDYGVSLYTDCRHSDVIKNEGIQRRFTKAVLACSDNKYY